MSVDLLICPALRSSVCTSVDMCIDGLTSIKAMLLKVCHGQKTESPTSNRPYIGLLSYNGQLLQFDVG